MGFFNPKPKCRDEILGCLRNYMNLYLTENPAHEDAINSIFSEVGLAIRRKSEGSYRRTMKKNDISAEFGMLNALHNYAITRITYKNPQTLILRSDNDIAYKLCNDINDLKLQKGYISEDEHEENATLAIRMALTPPGLL